MFFLLIYVYLIFQIDNGELYPYDFRKTARDYINIIDLFALLEIKICINSNIYSDVKERENEECWVQKKVAMYKQCKQTYSIHILYVYMCVCVYIHKNAHTKIYAYIEYALFIYF